MTSGVEHAKDTSPRRMHFLFEAARGRAKSLFDEGRADTHSSHDFSGGRDASPVDDRYRSRYCYFRACRAFELFVSD